MKAKKVWLECPSCKKKITLPNMVFLNANGVPTCTQCNKGLVRRVEKN